ncbi:MAG: DUF1080 domain-containing protein [Proteiniphilum sp.]|jgi:hypothetical protein|nr:DUF1080 domain-containing protein [Proteiniphilum sp.]
MIVTLSAWAQKPKGESLFDGHSLRGWKKLNGAAEYEVRDSAIVGISKMNTPNTFLATEKMYDNFVMEFDFKVDDGLNFGVLFRSDSLTKEYENGRSYGYQLWIDTAGQVWIGEDREWRSHVSIGSAEEKVFRKGEWNSARIEAVGSIVCVWVNGVQCGTRTDYSTPVPPGFIALQVVPIDDAALEGKRVAWRNIRLYPQELKPNTLSEQEVADGWKLLWDGKTTEGWRGAKSDHFPEKGWSIEDGILKVQKSDGGESTNGGDIVTTRPYKDFILMVDFKITEGANSGIKYFVDTNLNQGAGSAIGCEYQLLDDERHPDAKLGVKGNRTLGSLYDLIPAPQDKPFHWGSFNTAMVVVRGNHVEHWLNGVKIVEYERNSGIWGALVNFSKYKDWPDFGNAEKGLILLQDHGDEVWFRNIKIRAQ